MQETAFERLPVNLDQKILQDLCRKVRSNSESFEKILELTPCWLFVFYILLTYFTLFYMISLFPGFSMLQHMRFDDWITRCSFSSQGLVAPKNQEPGKIWVSALFLELGWRSLFVRIWLVWRGATSQNTFFRVATGLGFTFCTRLCKPMRTMVTLCQCQGRSCRGLEIL